MSMGPDPSNVGGLDGIGSFVTDIISNFFSTVDNNLTITDFINGFVNDASTVTGALNEFAATLIPLGLVLLSLRWALSLLNNVASKNFDLEVIVRSIMRLVFASIIVSNSLNLCDGAITFSQTLSTQISSSLVITNTAITVVKGIFTNVISQSLDMYTASYSFFFTVMLVCLVLAEGFTSIILTYNLAKNLLLYVIDIALAYVLAPVAMSDSYEGGINSGCVRFFRKFLSLTFIPIIIKIILVAMNTIIGNISSFYDGPFTPIVLIAIYLASLSFIRRANIISREIIC